MGVLLCGVSGVRVGWIEDGNDRDHERDGLGSRQWTSAGLSMQLLDSVPGQLVLVHLVEQLGMSQNVAGLEGLSLYAFVSSRSFATT